MSLVPEFSGSFVKLWNLFCTRHRVVAILPILLLLFWLVFTLFNTDFTIFVAHKNLYICLHVDPENA